MTAGRCPVEQHGRRHLDETEAKGREFAWFDVKIRYVIKGKPEAAIGQGAETIAFNKSQLARGGFMMEPDKFLPLSADWNVDDYKALIAKAKPAGQGQKNHCWKSAKDYDWTY